MKKLLSILLVLLMAVSLLPAAALADGPAVMLSRQNLRVDGKVIACEKYNIDCSNYFKLRDVAFVLNGTGSQFSVNWDGEKKCISLVAGEEYAPNGSELDLSGGDKSALAAPGTDTILVNGEDRTADLTAYKLEGNNFYKLRDLGSALGFYVDYDQPSNTAIVISRAFSEPTEWRVVESFTASNSGGDEHGVITYDEEGRLLSSYYDYGYYATRDEHTYNDLGYEVQEIYSYYSDYNGDIWEENSVTTYEYDKWGLMVKRVTTADGASYSEPLVTVETCEYDDNGLPIRRESQNIYNHSVTEFTYNERGDLLRSVSSYGEDNTYTMEYERDEEGRILCMRSIDSQGNVSYSYEYEYAGDLTVKEIYTSGDYRSVSTCIYDEQGNLIRRENDTTDWDSFTEYAYDGEGRVVEYVYYDGADMFTSCYVYDEEGRMVREQHEGPDDSYTLEYAFDADGNPLSETYTGSDCNSRTDYTYDRAEGRKTRTVVIEYPRATGIIISSEEITLAVGDTDYVYCYFEPYNSARETVTWSSSDESVGTVSQEGDITAVGAGTAVVTATSENGLTASCTVTVSAEKFRLTVSSFELALDAGETVPLHCVVECVGSWMPCSLRFQNYDDGVIFLQWAESWENRDEIDLFVTGLSAGTTDFDIVQKAPDDGAVYGKITVSVTVSGTNTDIKP